MEALGRRLTFQQFRDWKIYASLEPFGEWRADVRTAHIVSTLINVNRGKGQRVVTVEEAMLKFAPEEKKASKPFSARTQKEALEVLRVMSIMQNAVALQGTPEAKD